MSGTRCTCGCCAGREAFSAESNAPGQPALTYRLATYATFLDRMLAQIASPNTLVVPPASAWTIASLTTRSNDDPTIALLDAWSVVLDVLTFYQERIANEGFLRTATEHRSILELARAIGYELNPGVAAGTYLSFIVEDVIGTPSVAPLPTGPKVPSAPTQGAATYNAGIVTLSQGTQVVSVPPQGQMPQTFETSAELDARTEWNLMLPRITRPPDYAIDLVGNLYLVGIRCSFPAGTPTFGADQLYLLNPYPKLPAGSRTAAMLVQQLYLSGTGTGITVGDLLLLSGLNASGAMAATVVQALNVVVDNVGSQTRIDTGNSPVAVPFAPGVFSPVNVPSSPVAFSFSSVEQYVLDATIEDSDLQALIRVSGWDAEQLVAMANSIPSAGVWTQGVFSFSMEVSFFGHNAPKWKTLTNPGTVLRGDAYLRSWDAVNSGAGTLIWTDSQGDFYQDATVFFERAIPGILPSSWVLIEAGGAPTPFQVISAADRSLADYGLSGKTTGLVLRGASGQVIGLPGPPALAAYVGELFLLAANSDGNLYAQSGSPGKWGSFHKEFSGSFPEKPVILEYAPDRLLAFVVGADGQLYQSYGSDGYWGGISPLIRPTTASVQLTGTPSVTVDTPNQYDVIATGADGSLYHFWSDNGTWGGPEKHPVYTDATITAVSSPASAANGANVLDIVCIGSDGNLYHLSWNSRGWSLLTLAAVVPGAVKLTGSPAICASAFNPLDVFAIGADGNLYHTSYNQSGQDFFWAVFESRGGSILTGSPSVVLGGPSTLEVFCIGTDGNLYHVWYSNGWSSMTSLGGGNLVGSPSAISAAPSTMDVVAAGSDGSFYHWWFNNGWNGPETIAAGSIPAIYTRESKAHVLSQQQVLAELPVADDVEAGANCLMLNGLVTGLTAGQAVALTGTRADAPTVAIQEVVLLADIQHVGGFTQLAFEPPGLQFSYARASMTLNANTVAATNGATIAVPEVLGSGSASQTNQSFTLKRSPLTYVPAATSTGAQSTLQVRVNDLYWQQAPSLFGLGPTDRSFIARQDDDGTSTITFGDGQNGGLLPTGNNNITASYRVGLGTAGNLPAGTLSVLQSRPPGLRGVTNPIPASGGADPEVLAQARWNAPRTVLTIDRIVSLTDYENFAAGFAGIGKAQATTLVLGQSTFVQLTVAGVEGAAVVPSSPLLLSLGAAIEDARDPLPQVDIQSYQPILFNISANLILDITDYARASVIALVTDTVTAYFSFDQRSFAQPVTAAEIIASIQAVPGVVAVNLTQLYRNDMPPGADQPALNAYLPAAYARVARNSIIVPAEMLLLNPIGLSLKDLTP
jgi:hypothetical protein